MVSTVCWDVYVFLTDVNIARSVESSLPVLSVRQAVRGAFERGFFKIVTCGDGMECQGSASIWNAAGMFEGHRIWLKVIVFWC